MDETTRVAYHEAAHSVAAVSFGHDFHGVNIISHGDYAGSADGGGSWHDLKSAQERLICLFAGYIASLKIDPEEPKLHQFAALNDFEQAEGIMRAIGQADGKVWTSRAQDFVEANWEPIEIVALELLEKKYLDRTEIEILIDIADGHDQRESLDNYRTMRDAQ